MGTKAENSNTVNVVLVNPPPIARIESHDTPYHPHLGLAYLSAYLRQHGIICQAIDAKFERIDMYEVGRRLDMWNPSIVGVTAMTHEIEQARKVARLAKDIIGNKVLTVLGGAHATALPEETLANFPEFDVVVIGEGEITLFELVRVVSERGDLASVPGIAYRNSNGCIQRNCERELIADLNSLPLPAWDIFPKTKTYPVITNRGCPFKCNFCMRVSGNRVRKRSLESIIGEFQLIIEKYGATSIIVQDETFTVYKKRANALLDLLIQYGLNKRVKWRTQTRVDLVDLELLQKMKTAGCTWVGFGIESGDEEILSRTGKGIMLTQAEKAISMAKKAGLATGAYFIIGHPFETRQTALNTINFAAKLNTSTVAFGIMVPYPGTEIYEMAKSGKGGYKIISSNWSDFNKTLGNGLELEMLCRADLEKLQLLGYLKFYLRNLRLLGFLNLFLQERKVVFAVLRKLFFRNRNL